MDKLAYYRSCIQTLLENQSQSKPRNIPDLENQLIFVSTRDHYQLIRVGWEGLERIYYVVLHFDIKDGKVWLQRNATELEVGEELIKMGVDREDIVLGLHPPYKRPYTDYGVA